MRGAGLATFFPLLLATSTLASDSKKDPLPCTAKNPANGRFYDLNPISVKPIENNKKAHKDDRTESWHARGYDYNTNFTLNICAPVLEKLDDAVGIKDDLVKNISAFYTEGKKTYSIGQMSTEPVFRGRKLILNYTDGSPCDDDDARKLKRKLIDHDDDDEDDEDSGKKKSKKPSSSHSSIRRKSTIISFHCDADSLSPLHISFVAASPDSCTYFFEARSPSACGGAAAGKQQSINAGGVFTVIALVAIAVYLLGGIAYQRNVMHQRGWRQLPNYALWAGIGNFVTDMASILCGSCMRFVPRRRGGYDRLSGGRNGGLRVGGRGGSRTQEENGLIDSLDEEWND